MSPRRQFLSTACSSVPRETPHSGRTDLTITFTEQPIRGSGPSHAEQTIAGQQANTSTSGHHTRTADHRGAAGRYERNQLVAHSAIRKSASHRLRCNHVTSPADLYPLPRTAAFHVKPRTRRGRSGPHEISRLSRAVDHRAQPTLGLQRPSQAQRAIAGLAAIAGSAGQPSTSGPGVSAAPSRAQRAAVSKLSSQLVVRSALRVSASRRFT